MMSVHVNDQLLDLNFAVDKQNVDEGCSSMLDPCRYVQRFIVCEHFHAQ